VLHDLTQRRDHPRLVRVAGLLPVGRALVGPESRQGR
jgi:hypothetical protein